MWRMYSMAISQSLTTGGKPPFWSGSKHIGIGAGGLGGKGGLGGLGGRGAKRALAGLGVWRAKG